MIFTDQRSVITSDIGAPPVVHVQSLRPVIVPEADSYVVQQPPEVAPLIIEYVQSASVVMTPEKADVLMLMSEGPQGIPGPPGPGVARYTKVLSGVRVEIPASEHELTGVAFVKVYDQDGAEVSVAAEVTPAAVVIESIVPMTGHTAILE